MLLSCPGSDCFCFFPQLPWPLFPFFANLLQSLCLSVTLPHSFNLYFSTGSIPSVYPPASPFHFKHIFSLKSLYTFTLISFILLKNVLKELHFLSSFHPNLYDFDKESLEDCLQDN